MLYSGNCVVLFYGNAGGYSYTRIGRITNTQGLATAVGSGDVTVTFSVATTDLQSAASSRPATYTYLKEQQPFVGFDADHPLTPLLEKSYRLIMEHLHSLLPEATEAQIHYMMHK